MNPRKETTYGILLLIAAVLFVLPCIFLVFPTFDISLDDLWQMDSLMEFICAYKNTLILAIAGVFIQIVIALPAGYAIARVATVYKGNIIKNLIMDCQSYTKYRPNETTGGIFVSWRRKEELPTGA